MTNLVPERRTDKNGVTSTKWVRPDGQKKKAARIPAPATPASKKRAEDIEVITSAVVRHQIHLQSMGRSLEAAKDEELSLIADSLKTDDEELFDLVASTVAMGGVVNAVTMAVVYDKGLPKQHRVPKIYDALSEANMFLLDIAHDDLMVDDYIDLATCDDSTRTQVKRFVATYCAMRFDRQHYVDWEIMEQVMDTSREDNDRAIEIIREDPTISFSELNFRLEGGHTAVSRGAL